MKNQSATKNFVTTNLGLYKTTVNIEEDKQITAKKINMSTSKVVNLH